MHKFYLVIPSDYSKHGLHIFWMVQLNILSMEMICVPSPFAKTVQTVPRSTGFRRLCVSRTKKRDFRNGTVTGNTACLRSSLDSRLVDIWHLHHWGSRETWSWNGYQHHEEQPGTVKAGKTGTKARCIRNDRDGPRMWPVHTKGVQVLARY